MILEKALLVFILPVFLSPNGLLEEEMATHSSILAWRIESHGKRSLVGSSPWGRKESDMTERLGTQQRTCEASRATVKGLRSERKKQCRILDLPKCMLSRSIWLLYWEEGERGLRMEDGDTWGDCCYESRERQYGYQGTSRAGGEKWSEHISKGGSSFSLINVKYEREKSRMIPR